ncbi:MAG: acyltransferase domain-containing protein, partial [Jatrophihabitantaceae bacterium]
MDQLEPIFAEELGLSLRATIATDEPQPVDVIQPMIFAVQLGLVATWRAHGLQPAAVLGHSVGEIAAAVTAGMLTLEQGARLVCRRSVLLRSVVGQGALIMVNLAPEEAERRLAGRQDAVLAIAAAPSSSVIAGDIPAIAELADRLRAEGLAVRPVDTDVAFHSPQMDPLLAGLTAAAADLPPSPAAIDVYNTALADPRDDQPRDGRYWAANLRGQVRFGAAVSAALADGYRLFVEVSPHPVVEHSVLETFDALEITDGFVTHTLRRNRPELQTLLANLAALYCHGAAVSWPALWPAGELVDLPPIAWQRRQLWAAEPAAGSGQGEQHDPASHTLLGARSTVRGATPAQLWLTYLDRASRPYPGNHPVRDVEIIPAAVLLNTFHSAALATGQWSDLADVALRVPVSVTKPRDLQVVLQNSSIRLSSRIAGAEADELGWVTHTTATIEAHTGPAVAGSDQPVPPLEQELPTGYVIERLATLGVAAMGFSWTVERLQRGESVLVAEVQAEPSGDASAGSWAPMLDAVLSIASVAFSGPPTLRMPAHIHRLSLAESCPARARITTRVLGNNTVDVEVSDLDGTPVASFSRLRYGMLGEDDGAIANPRELVHPIAWAPLPTALLTTGSAATLPPVVLVGADCPLLARLAGRLAAGAVPYRVASGPDQLRPEELTGQHLIVVV